MYEYDFDATRYKVKHLRSILFVFVIVRVNTYSFSSTRFHSHIIPGAEA